MARLSVQTTSSNTENSSPADTSRCVTSESPASPVLSFSSDKENRGQSKDPELRGTKRKLTSSKMASSSSAASGSSNKKRELGDGSRDLSSRAAHRRELEERVDRQYFDPDQDIEKRRATRKGMR